MKINSVVVLFFLLAIGMFSSESVPNVSVTIEQRPSGLVRTLQTDGSGKATFTNLPPGNYWITITIPSETTQKIEKIKLNQQATVVRIPDSLIHTSRVIKASVSFEKTISTAEQKLRVLVTVSGTSLVVLVSKEH